MGILENILGTKEQNETAQKNLDKQASEGSKLAKFLGGNPAPKEVKETPQPVEKKAKGGSVKSASARADGCCIRGKTRA